MKYSLDENAVLRSGMSDRESTLSRSPGPELRMQTEINLEIAQLEEKIEDLAERARACDRIRALATAALMAGAVLLVLTTIGLLGRSPVPLVLGCAALLGGITLLGSNRSTREQIGAAMDAAQARRHELINALELRSVPEV